MSPEQCSQSEQIDSRSDIYSLGVILFEMLVGHVPFVGDSPTVVMLKHLQEPPPSVLDERKDLPAGVATVVAKALAKRREDRYQTAEALVEDLVIAEGTGLVQAGPMEQTATANRVVVPTPPRSIEAPVEDDEQTLVRPRTPAYVPPHQTPVRMAPPPPPVSGFKPLRIIIPAVAGLVVVFAVIWAFTRTTQPANSNQQGQVPGLTADPNSQAVQPAAPPTGQNEKGIPLGGALSPTSNANTSANSNANAATSPAPGANENANAANDNKAVNANSNRPQELPSPRKAPEASPQTTNPLLPSPTLPPVSPKPTTAASPPPPVGFS
jgi:serine/threonine-protein kinase